MTMTAHADKLRSFSRRAVIAALSGLLAFIGLILVQGLVGTILGGLLFIAAPILIVVAVVLAAIELTQVRRGRVSKDGVALAVIGLVCSLLAALVFVWLIFWLAAA